MGDDYEVLIFLGILKGHYPPGLTPSQWNCGAGETI